MATEQEWSSYADDTFEGELTGNAEFARKIRDTPLQADAILDMVWENVGYFGDRYYAPLTRPIEMRVEEYLGSRHVEKE